MSDRSQADSEVVKTPVAVALQKEVKKEIANCPQQVRSNVVDHLIATELKKRTNLLTEALGRREHTWEDIQKIKPDQEQYDADGERTGSSFSKIKSDERKGLIKRLNKIDRAINIAIENADYDALEKLDKS